MWLRSGVISAFCSAVSGVPRRSAAALTEALRGPKPLEDYSLYESVVQAQTALINAISALENG